MGCPNLVQDFVHANPEALSLLAGHPFPETHRSSTTVRNHPSMPASRGCFDRCCYFRRVVGRDSHAATDELARVCRIRAETDVSSSAARMRAILWVLSSTDTAMFFIDGPHRNSDSQYTTTGLADTNIFHCPNGRLRSGHRLLAGTGHTVRAHLRVPIASRNQYQRD